MGQKKSFCIRIFQFRTGSGTFRGWKSKLRFSRKKIQEKNSKKLRGVEIFYRDHLEQYFRRFYKVVPSKNTHFKGVFRFFFVGEGKLYPPPRGVRVKQLFTTRFQYTCQFFTWISSGCIITLSIIEFTLPQILHNPPVINTLLLFHIPLP